MKQNEADWDKIYSNVDIDKIPFPSSLAKQFIEIIKNILPPGASLLEAGSGSGEISAHLAANGYKVTLLDQSEAALDLSKKFFTKHRVTGQFIKGDFFQMPFGDKSFDCVWNSGVMEHFSDEEIIQGLKEMKRVSRDKVITMVPSAWAIFYRLGKLYLEWKNTWPYGKEIPRARLALFFKKAGFSQISEDYIQVYWGIQWLDQFGALGKFLGSKIYGLYAKNPRAWERNRFLKKFLGYLLLSIGSV